LYNPLHDGGDGGATGTASTSSSSSSGTSSTGGSRPGPLSGEDARAQRHDAAQYRPDALSDSAHRWSDRADRAEVRMRTNGPEEHRHCATTLRQMWSAAKPLKNAVQSVLPGVKDAWREATTGNSRRQGIRHLAHTLKRAAADVAPALGHTLKEFDGIAARTGAGQAAYDWQKIKYQIQHDFGKFLQQMAR
jgi:hypothetical protein